MEILYVSRLCSETRFSDLLRDLPISPPQQEQKFHGLLARGLASSAEGITALSVLPAKPGIGPMPGFATEGEEGISYQYLSLRMIPVVSHGVIFFWSFFSSLRWAWTRRHTPRFVVCDVLNLSITMGAWLASKLVGFPSLAIVTDIPDYLHEYIGWADSSSGRLIIRAYRTLATFFMERYDGYILLTEEMNNLVNPRARPYLVVEGMVDSGMGEVSNPVDGKFPEDVILYAGALYFKYGVGTLIEAFLLVPQENARLWLYGSGELEQMIRDLEVQDPRIHFWGVRPNAEVVEAEVRATLLINPRPSNQIFTKFSFPSKNMEYMASGTPVLTAPLPGMPEEYLDQVYIFTDETAAGMANMLTRLLDLPREELHRRGMNAKAFVMSRKTNLMQSGRVHAFMEAMSG